MPHSLRLIESQKGLAVCDLTGRIDALSSPQLKQDLTAFLEESKPKLVVQMRELTFIAASGLNVLLEFAQQAYARKGGMKLVAPGSDIRRVLDKVRFTQLFDVLDSEEAAVAAFSSGRTGQGSAA
jgi:anti-sigma B factor antagonist